MKTVSRPASRLLMFWILVFTVMFLASTASRAQQNALHFDGSNDYVTMAIPAVLQDPSSNDFTVSAWVRPGSFSTQRVFFAQQDSTHYASVLINALGTVYFYVGAGGTQVGPTSAATLPLNSWSHLTLVWRAGTSTAEIYIDGVAQTLANGGSTSQSSNGTMAIGGKADGTQVFNGAIDEFNVYGAALSAADIATLAQGMCNLAVSPVASYRFNQGTAGADNTGVTSLLDSAGSNHGTLHNFALNGSTSNWIASDVAPSSCYTVAGNVSGLTGSGLVLQLNGADDQTITADGPFSFPPLADGSNYAVSVLTQPASPAQTCTVNNGSGTLADANVTGVEVSCVTLLAPGVPTNVQVVFSGNTATVSWSPPLDDGGSPITGYTVLVSPGGLSCTTSGNPAPTSCQVSGLLPDELYTFTVTASNLIGEGAEATLSVRAPALAVPATPVPTLSSGVMLLLMLSVSMMALARLRRQRVER